jgi:hypothetical protein
MHLFKKLKLFGSVRLCFRRLATERGGLQTWGVSAGNQCNTNWKLGLPHLEQRACLIMHNNVMEYC